MLTRTAYGLVVNFVRTLLERSCIVRTCKGRDITSHICIKISDTRPASQCDIKSYASWSRFIQLLRTSTTSQEHHTMNYSCDRALVKLKDTVSPLDALHQQSDTTMQYRIANYITLMKKIIGLSCGLPCLSLCQWRCCVYKGHLIVKHCL